VYTHTHVQHVNVGLAQLIITHVDAARKLSDDFKPETRVFWVQFNYSYLAEGITALH